MGLSWSRGYSQISESRERNCDPWCEPGRGKFQLQMRKQFFSGQGLQWLELAVCQGVSSLSGLVQTRPAPFGQCDWVAPSCFSWRCLEMGMSQGDGLTLELLCFPHRDYTEDGQAKTERKYSYSEYRPLFSRATSQACGQMLGTSLQWGRAQN